MTDIRIGAAALVAATVAACGPSPKATVLEAESRWMTAMQQRDLPVLDGLMGPEFTLAGADPSDRPPVPRGVWLDNAMHHLTLTEARVDRAAATVDGRTATVRATLTWAGAYDGEAFRETVQLVDVWKHRDGRWQVVSRRVGATAGS